MLFEYFSAFPRHSRFGGTYVIQNMKAIGDNQMLCHKPYEKVEALEFNSQKVRAHANYYTCFRNVTGQCFSCFFIFFFSFFLSFLPFLSFDYKAYLV